MTDFFLRGKLDLTALIACKKKHNSLRWQCL